MLDQLPWGHFTPVNDKPVLVEQNPLD